jgi:hypothetical protein
MVAFHERFMIRKLCITILLSVSLSCSQQGQQEVEVVDNAEQPELSESETLSLKERCKRVPSKSEPQISSSTAGSSKPLKDAKPVERSHDEIREVPNQFPTPEDIQKCRKLNEREGQ